jgi:uncharacterized membrane protein (DUF4010 family)
MNQGEIFTRLSVALAIGMLIGLERGWRTRDEQDHQRAAGFRTFALSGFLGGVTGLIGVKLGGLFVGIVFAGFAAAFTAFHWLEARAEHNLSATSVVAGMMTFLLGTLAAIGDVGAAIASAVSVACLLALRESLHGLIATIKWKELRAILVLLAMSFLLLPILPNRTVDPWDSFNPYQIWAFTILIAATSFVGYVAVRVFGNRLGVVATAIAGGMASSTATTFTFAHLAKKNPGSSRILYAGILIAGAVMMIRVGVFTIVLNRSLLPDLLPALGAAATVLVVGAGIGLVADAERDSPNLEIENPLAIGAALKLAVFMSVVTICAKLLSDTFGSTGALLIASLSAIIDVDAVAVSMARLGGNPANQKMAADAVLLAVAVNTLSKVGITIWVGGVRTGLFVAGGSVAALCAGGVVARLSAGS